MYPSVLNPPSDRYRCSAGLLQGSAAAVAKAGAGRVILLADRAVHLEIVSVSQKTVEFAWPGWTKAYSGRLRAQL